MTTSPHRHRDRQAGQAAGVVAVEAAQGATRSLAPGEVLYRQGDSTQEPALYAVVTGLLLVEHEAPGGHRHLLAVLAPGDLAGEVGALDPRPRSARITSHGPSTVSVVPRERLLAWLTTHPGSVEQVLRGLSRRVERAEGQLTDVINLSTSARLARLLVELANRLGVAGPEGVTVEHGLTQDQLASLTGSSRESVNKALRAMARSNWLTHSRGRLLIQDLDALRAASLAPNKTHLPHQAA